MNARLVFALAVLAAWPALAQTRQPAQITTLPTTTPQEFDLLDKNGNWTPFGTASGGAFVNMSAPVDVRVFGANPLAADNTTAIHAAAASGKNLLFPAGTWNFSDMQLTQNQRVFCETPSRTILAQDSTTGDFITMSGWFNSVQHCQFQPSVRTSGYQVTVAPSCLQCSVTDFWMNNHYNSILANQGAVLTDGLIGSTYGHLGIEFVGTSGARANNLFINNVLINNTYPVGYVAVTPFVVAWAPNLTVQYGQVTRVNGYIYQQTAAGSCTTASSGSGPSGVPAGATPQSVWSGRIADGTCQWGVESQNLIGLDWGNYAYSVYAKNFVTLNNQTSVKTHDDFGSPGDLAFDYPAFGSFIDLVGDHNFWQTFDAEGGMNFQLINVYACSSLTLVGIQTGANFLGDLKVIGGRVCDNWTDGIYITAGTQITIDGASVGSNSLQAAGTHNNIEIGAGVSDFSITNNKVGKDAGAGPLFNNFANYGIAVNNGASDYYVITGNTCSGFVRAGCAFDGGSGTHKTVSGNW